VKDIIGGRADSTTLALSQTVAIRESKHDSRLIECDDSFGNFEMQILLEWLVGDLKGDIRYNLARVLHSPAVQDKFNRVIIDAPPRMTTGLINALCASTHLVVPFVLDVLSAERVGLFLRTVKKMRGELFPHLDLAYVVGTLKHDSTLNLKDSEQDAIEEAEKGVATFWGPGDYVRKDILIPRKLAISEKAGIGVAKNIDCFDRLGERLYTLTGSVKHPSAA
jgi:chromosome partitioning protein